MFGFFKRRKDKKEQDAQAKAQAEQQQHDSADASTLPVASSVESTQDLQQPPLDEIQSEQLQEASRAEMPARVSGEEMPAPIPDHIEEPVAPQEDIADLAPNPTARVETPDSEELTVPAVETSATAVELPPTPLEQEKVQPDKLETPDSVLEQAPAESASVTELQPETQEKPKKKGLFARLKEGLTKTRTGFTEGVANLLLGKKAIDDDLLEELETQLLMADVGVEATQNIIRSLTEKVSRKELKDSDALFAALKSELGEMLADAEQPLDLDGGNRQPGEPYVILMVGVNGVGKTTTIGKLAKKFQAEGKSVMLAAGDTFRAAAVEQLQVWGQRNQVPVVAQHTGADSASVIFDAIQSAKNKGVDVVIADTAGRLHNKSNLMQELEKVVRVMKKLSETAPHEVLLVLDACTGQNALNQAKQFQQAVGVSGLVLTKLDGTAKGGIIFAIAKQLGLPVRFIGVGERAEDLRVFQAKPFVDALFDVEEGA